MEQKWFYSQLVVSTKIIVPKNDFCTDKFFSKNEFKFCHKALVISLILGAIISNIVLKILFL